MNLVIFFCYTFVFGTALPMLIAPTYPAWSVKIAGLPLTHWLFLLFFIFGVLAFLFYKNFFSPVPVLLPAERVKTKWNASQAGRIAFLGLAALALAVGNYYRAADTSSPNHILRFLDSSFADKTMVRGTIVHDLDDRGTHTFIHIQPEEIIKFSDREIEIDLNHPHVEFRTKVERVIDGDTIQLFESPPVYLFPEMDLEPNREVRLLGLNAPEIPHPKINAQEAGIEAEPGGEEAKEFLKKLVEGKFVVLKIAKSEPQDRYGRWLALIYILDSRLRGNDKGIYSEESVNEIILKNNFARVAFVKEKGLVHLKPTAPVKLSGKTGLIRTKVHPSVGEELYGALSYGQRVEVVQALLETPRLSNPAGFDYGKFLLARSIYAMTLPVKTSEQIRLLGEGETNPLVTLSLNLKKKMTAALRETMPYPQSAFLGGVTLGLRGGLPDEVKREFQATGVAHVLAVSGLHVGFVAVLLLAISRVFGLPKKVTFLFVVFGLVVFTIITGASPATRRAAMMFSIGQFLYSFGGFGVRRATVLTIPLAACIMLLQDPLKLPDGSFILSFMAVWSLAHLSGPLEKFFRWNDFTKGFLFFPYFFSLLFLTFVSLISIAGGIQVLRDQFSLFGKIPLMNDWMPNYLWTILGVYAIGVILYFGFKYMTKLDLIESSYRNAAGRAALVFTCAQLAILIGMMWPLSSIFFQRFPISGSWANFLAIPLIGFIVQYGLIASSLITMTRLFFASGPDHFLTSLLGLSYTPIGFALLISVLILVFFAGTLAYRIVKNIQDPFFNLKEEIGKYAPSMLFIIGFLMLSLMEKEYRAATHLALRIQAFNWALCDSFLSMAKNWAGYIPYPYVDQLTPLQTTAYYSGVLLLAFSPTIQKWFKRRTQTPAQQNRFLAQRLKGMRLPPSASHFKFGWAGIGSALILLAAAVLYATLTKKPEKLSLTFFNCGQGNALLIYTPLRRAILIDGGWGGAVARYDDEEMVPLGLSEERQTRKRRQAGSGWDFGESGIAPTLSKYAVHSLDLIVNTSPRPGNLSAIPYLVENFPVKEVVLPYAPETFLDSQGNLVEEEAVFRLWGLAQTTYLSEDGEEIKPREPDRYEPFLKTAMKIYADLAKNKNIKVRSARAGDVLYQEEFGGKKLSLTVLHPRGELKEGELYFKQGDDPVGARSLILKLAYGDFSCLIPTQASLKTIESFLEKRREELKSELLLLPKHGHPFWNTGEWLAAVQPKAGIIQYGYLPVTQGKFVSVRMRDWYLSTTEKRLRAVSALPLRTDQLGAIVIESDGSAVDLKKDVRWMLSARKFKDAAMEEGGEKLHIGIE